MSLRLRRRLAHLPVALLGLTAWLACSHSEALSPSVPASTGPLVPGAPARLTYNPLTDLNPSWLPDGSGILYSFQVPGRVDRDHCLGLLPAAGGSRVLEICDPKPETNDTSDVYRSSAADRNGRVVYNLFRALASVHTPQFGSTLELIQLESPLYPQVLQSLPYTLPTGEMHTGASDLSWLDASRLVYVGGEIYYIRMPLDTIGTAPDTLVAGRDIVVLELLGSGVRLTAVPNTRLGSSVSPDPTGNALYYTVLGDSRVYRIDLAGGSATVIHDFGPGRIARDVDVVGTTLAAVVGGIVQFLNDPSLGPVQPDEGGVLTVVDLTTGVESVLDQSTTAVYRRPAISPDGARLVAERYQVVSGATVDRRADLYLFQLP